MELEFDVDKIVRYLEQYKATLPSLYEWKSKLDKLVDYKLITEVEVAELEMETPYKKELALKAMLHKMLSESIKDDPELFDKICLWIIKDWGGIKGAKDSNTLELLSIFKKGIEPSFDRIASVSKVGSFLYPKEYIIYDSRVAYSLNWILLSENAGNVFFPMPSGRNSKMLVFDMNVLIRLKHIETYQEKTRKELEKSLYINNKDKLLFIPKKQAYKALNTLIKAISRQLWEGKKAEELYHTEMLLFSIADREIYRDIVKRLKLIVT